MTTIAHISDVHLAPLPKLRPAELLNKRFTGFINWHLNRSDYMHRDLLVNLVTHMKALRPDFVAVTGDLINLGHPLEMEASRKWLEALGPAEKVCVVPGNHDAYVPGAHKLAREVWGEYMSGEKLDGAHYPYVRRVDDVAVIGCSSAIATPPFMAHGDFDQAQADRLDRCLQLLGKGEYFRIVLIHHPPAGDDMQAWRRGLYGAERFAEVVATSGAELVLHGHIHRSTINALRGPLGDIPVIGVAAASASAHEGEDPARYNLFKIERAGTKWQCKMTEYGYQRIGTEVSKRLHMRIY